MQKCDDHRFYRKHRKNYYVKYAFHFFLPGLNALAAKVAEDQRKARGGGKLNVFLTEVFLFPQLQYKLRIFVAITYL